VKVYKSETQKVLARFLHQQLSFPDCIAALDAALARLIPRLSPEGYGVELTILRDVMLANNEAVMREMEQRVRREVKAKHAATS
jgi:hypothetical protein